MNLNTRLKLYYVTMVILLATILIPSIPTPMPAYAETYTTPTIEATDETEPECKCAEEIIIEENPIPKDIFSEPTVAYIPDETIESTEEPEIIETEEVEVVPPHRELNFTDMSRKSGLTAEEFDYILNENIAERYGYTDSTLLNTGSYLVHIEETYNVNGLLAIAISSWESGHGRSNIAINKNNLFGLSYADGKSRKAFDSKFECFDYWGSLIRHHYIDKGYDTIDEIAYKYCYNSHIEWASVMYDFVDIYADSAYNFING